MKRYLFAACSALLLSAIVTELHFRLFQEHYFALLLLTALAIFIGALATGAFAGAPVARARAAEAGARARSRKPAEARRRRKPVQGDGAGDETRREAEPDSEEKEEEAGRETGTVKWFNRNKGYGFIARDNGGEIFVHYKAIRGSGRRGLRDGQRVSFNVVEHEKGLQADKVSGVRSEQGQ